MKPMLARLVRALPDENEGYVFEPKWDGFRSLASRDGERIELLSRHGRSLTRYFPELVAALAHLSANRWTIDGEVLVTLDGRFDFEALMGRLHPAESRVRELAQKTPASFVAFDLPEVGDEPLLDAPFGERRRRLADLLHEIAPPLFLTPATEDRAIAERWLAEFCGGGLDGVIAKPRDLRYLPGARAMLKVKHERTADCVAAGARASADPPEVWSLLLGLYDDADALEHIGVASSFSRATRARLVAELAPLVTDLAGHPWEHGFLTGGGAMGRLKGAAGRWEPGMTLDWTPLRPERVVEVSYTQLDGYRLRHPAKLVRWRPDRDPDSCRIEQLDVPAPDVESVLSK
ncbi:MAG: ATP-dependent DNA ligase [Solirubrobacteraceae bacterium]